MSVYFVHAADGPIRAVEEVQALQPNVRVTNVEPLNRKGSSVQRVREGMPLWKVYVDDKEGAA